MGFNQPEASPDRTVPPSDALSTPSTGSLLVSLWQPLERLTLPSLSLKLRAALRTSCTASQELMDAKPELFWRPLVLAVTAPGLDVAAASSHELQHFLKQQCTIKLQAGK